MGEMGAASDADLRRTSSTPASMTAPIAAAARTIGGRSCDARAPRDASRRRRTTNEEHARPFLAHESLGDRVELPSFDPAAVRVVDLFDAWVFAARDAENALAAWSVSPRGDRADAFAVYRAAAEREERAAAVLRLGVAARL